MVEKSFPVAESISTNSGNKSPPDLTIIRIDEWEKRLNSLLASGTRSSLVDGLPDEGVDGGMTVPPIVTPPFIAEASQSFVKFFGDSSNREDHTTLVFDEVERSGCHWACTYPKKKSVRGRSKTVTSSLWVDWWKSQMIF